MKPTRNLVFYTSWGFMTHWKLRTAVFADALYKQL